MGVPEEKIKWAAESILDEVKCIEERVEGSERRVVTDDVQEILTESSRRLDRLLLNIARQCEMDDALEP